MSTLADEIVDRVKAIQPSTLPFVVLMTVGLAREPVYFRIDTILGIRPAENMGSIVDLSTTVRFVSVAQLPEEVMQRIEAAKAGGQP